MLYQYKACKTENDDNAVVPQHDREISRRINTEAWLEDIIYLHNYSKSLFVINILQANNCPDNVLK